MADKIYALLMALISIGLITALYRFVSTKAGHLASGAWAAVLFWVITPKNFWAIHNVMLEVTMTVFCLGAVYVSLLACRRYRRLPIGLLSLSAVLLLCGLLTKGLVALFPLAVFGIIWSVDRRAYPLWRAVTDTLFVGLACLSLLALVMYVWPEADVLLRRYWDVQIMCSLKGDAVVVPRWTILKVMLQELSPMYGMALVMHLIMRHRQLPSTTGHSRQALIFILLGLSASLPILVSPKQLSFYIVPSLPYFALGAALLIAPYTQAMEQWLALPRKMKWGKALLAILLLSAAILTYTTADRPMRHADELADIQALDELLGEQRTIDFNMPYSEYWSEISYAERLYGIHLRPLRGESPTGDYLMTAPTDPSPEGHKVLELPFKKFRLHERTD